MNMSEHPGLGVVFALMTSCFYVAIDRLPLGTVVLAQIPTPTEVIGVALIVAAVAVHRDPSQA
jgi:threonine/homoserine efflux transporter RhtA